MRLTQIRDFLAVVDAGSIRAAARELGVSQPALTKSVRQLEEELGAVLVARSVRGAQPTAFGRVFLARARAVNADLRRAREEIAQLRGSREGSLAIGSAPGPALGLLPEALVRLRKGWPQASLRIVDISPPEVLPALRQGSLDLALSVRNEPLAETPTDCLVEPLYLNRTAIVARRGHPLAGARRLAQLAEAEWVRTGFPGNSSALPDLFSNAGLPPPRYRAECTSFLMVPELVAQSDLLAVVPWQIVAREGKAGRIVRVAVRESLPAREISLFRRADVPLTPIARECVDILRSTAKQYAPAAA
ncbi:MAG TPA: LysR substrate-binding domain-containing protein [Burkholderiales bacterium]|nr:LysR substrate-binding domain-containing protein [Burkholderiales bacterium]